MKRGLILWDRKELPLKELSRRVDILRSSMRRENLDAVITYGDACQSGNLSYPAHFFPYADTAVCVIPIAAQPRLFTTHAYRNLPWFKTITWVEDIICTDAVGQEAADFLNALAPPPRTIGLVDTLFFPYAISEVLRKKTGAELIDFSREFKELRASRSVYELGFFRKAAEISVACFQDLSPHLHKGVTGFDLAAELEFAARKRGAEDLRCLIQADTSPAGLTGPNARPIRRDCSIEIAVEYMGYWAKLARTFFLESASPLLWRRVDDFAGAYARLMEVLSSSAGPRDFLEGMSSALRAGGENPHISLLINRGLEPYWSADSWNEADLDRPLTDNAAVYLQAALTFPDSTRLLRTDTIILQDKRPELLTSF